MPNASWPRACLIEGIFDGDAGQHVAAISCGQLRTGSSASPRHFLAVWSLDGHELAQLIVPTQ